MSARKGRAILGGSFNPPHIGHLRLVVEVYEALGGMIDGVDLMPCARPPHKDITHLLPFDLRAAMLDALVGDTPFLRCNRQESLRDGESYTWMTLQDCRKAAPDTDFYFIMGSVDFAQLPDWFRGLELPALCHFVVAPRGEDTVEAFAATTRAFWPKAEERPCALPGGSCTALTGEGGGSGGLAYFLPLPRLDVSASYLRRLWLAGRSLDYLVPEAALRLLRESRHIVDACWRGAGHSAQRDFRSKS
jgi:nicotinate-nucleotide adenylyltransferase